jgi:DNA polymerase III subunit delta'
MSLHPPVGHESLRTSLSRAWSRKRLPPVLLLHGQPGVGKTRLGLWIGQLLVCAAPDPQTGPCDACTACRQALRLEHPDLHPYVPVERPRATGNRDKEDEALEDQRRLWIESVRIQPLHPTVRTQVLALHVGTVRNLRKEVQKGRGVGPTRIFIISNAEELVSQDASPEAANALLKLLEEPPEACWFVLTASEVGRLLPTIRSRSTALHVPPLTASEVVNFLMVRLAIPETEAWAVARRSGGSLGRALGFLPQDGEDGPLEKLRKDGFRLLHAALAPRSDRAFAQALGFGVSGGRAQMELLALLELALRDLGTALAGIPHAIVNDDMSDWLGKRAAEGRLDPTGPLRALALVEESREALAGNVNPQLVMAALLTRLREVLLLPQTAEAR